ncbi:MAG: Gfo/Idh/MocA family protein [Bryobacteraceae bacterium]
MNRRSFAMGALTALGASRVAGASDRIRLGMIGTGGRGRQDLGTFLKQPDVDPVAVCDLYDPFRDKAIEMAEGRPKAFRDFRQVLEQKDIDAVIVATPDHWHALIAIAACEAGKDVYCEKPLSLTVVEGRRMVEAARKHGRVFQTGSQQRSGAHYAQAVKLIRDGGIGEVHRIQAGMQRNIFPGLKPTEMASGIRPGFDWTMWLGPAPQRPFDPFRCIYNFRWFWDYSGGQMTNWGAHHLDIARWIAGADAPTEVAGFGGRYALTDGGETPDIQQVTYQFPKVVINWTVSEIAEGKPVTLEIYGTKGMLTLLRSGFQVTPENIGSGKDRKPAMEPLQARGGDLDSAHARNFLDCVKSRQRPNADVEEGHRSAVMCHLGNISTRLGRSLRWDAATEQIAGDAEANQWLSRAYRAPWKLG